MISLGFAVQKCTSRKFHDLITSCVFNAEPLSDIDINVPGQTGNAKLAKLPIKKKTKKGEPRDWIFYVNDQKCRRGIVLNAANISEEGDAACFKLPFRSPDDSSASVPLKKVLAYLKITDLSKLTFNIDEKTREPEAVAVSEANHMSNPCPMMKSLYY